MLRGFGSGGLGIHIGIGVEVVVGWGICGGCWSCGYGGHDYRACCMARCAFYLHEMGWEERRLDVDTREDVTTSKAMKEDFASHDPIPSSPTFLFSFLYSIGFSKFQR